MKILSMSSKSSSRHPWSTILLLATILRSAQSQSFYEYFSGQNPLEKNIVKEPLTDKPYDFIVVGAGTGGSVVANRLSENPNWRVLLVEAGGIEGYLNQVPMLVSFSHLTEDNWGYKVEPQQRACLGMVDHRCPWPTGKSLGGTSAINYMIHTRGSRFDFDNWQDLGNEGWSYENVLPYFKKSEKFFFPGINSSYYHGTDGYLNVESAPHHTLSSQAFLRAGKDLGYKIVDYNGKDQIGFSYLQLNMNNGHRCSAAKAYLTVQRPNLHILTRAQVTKITIKEKKAYGVTYMKDGKRYTVKASKEVILSAGTINTAQLLMLSGIGPKQHLKDLDIDLIHDAPVGHNLYEHVGFLGLTFLVERRVSLSTSRVFAPGALVRYMFNNGGPMSVAGGAEALAFLRTRFATDARPDLELLFVSGSLHSDNGMSLRRSLGITEELYDAVYKPIEGRDAFSIWPIIQNPRSVGRVRLKSKNPLQAPEIQPNFFQYISDVEIILEGIRHAINISRTQQFVAYGARLHHLKIPGCKRFDFASDNYWRCAIRQLPAMMNHEVGTAKMGPDQDPTAVVDPQLRVRGVKGLRVADASIMPTIPTGHTNAVVYMIGEKAADMIKETWLNAK